MTFKTASGKFQNLKDKCSWKLVSEWGISSPGKTWSQLTDVLLHKAAKVFSAPLPFAERNRDCRFSVTALHNESSAVTLNGKVLERSVYILSSCSYLFFKQKGPQKFWPNYSDQKSCSLLKPKTVYRWCCEIQPASQGWQLPLLLRKAARHLDLWLLGFRFPGILGFVRGPRDCLTQWLIL